MAFCRKSIRKFTAGGHRKAEEKNVMGLALYAKERGYRALIFTRDRDGRVKREEAIEAGITKAAAEFDVAIAGAVAVEAIEAWLLALLGDLKADQYNDPKTELDNRGYTTLDQKLELIDAHQGGLQRAEVSAFWLGMWSARVRAIPENP